MVRKLILGSVAAVILYVGAYELVRWKSQSASAVHVATPRAGGRVCPHCGSQQVGKVRGLPGFGEVMTFIVLFFFFVIPAIIYYIYVESLPYCSGCGRRV